MVRLDGRPRFGRPPALLLALLSCAALLAASTDRARAQDAAGPEWGVNAVAQLWLTSAEGTSGTDGVDAPVGDSALHAGLLARTELWRGRWGTFVEYSRTVGRGRLATPTDGGTAPGFDLAIDIVQAGAGYRIGRVPATSAVEVFAGGRRVHHAREPDAGTPADVFTETRESWVEPFGGARFVSALGGGFHLTVIGALGGWGVGSEYRWGLRGVLAYELGDRAALLAGYRYTETEHGAAGDPYRWQGRVQGWLFGAGLSL